MREEGGVKVNAEPSFVRKIDPSFEVLRLDLISVCKLAVLKNRVASVKI
jgi:hypothetical protein